MAVTSSGFNHTGKKQKSRLQIPKVIMQTLGMKQLLLATLATTLLTGTPVLAEEANKLRFFYDYTNPEVVETILVYISDEANEGCWTNLGEARTYAEDQLRLKGYKITDNDEFRYGDWQLMVHVQASRDSGLCWGRISVELYTFDEAFGTQGKLQIGGINSSFIDYENVNLVVLDTIKKATSAFPKR